MAVGCCATKTSESSKSAEGRHRLATRRPRVRLAASLRAVDLSHLLVVGGGRSLFALRGASWSLPGRAGRIATIIAGTGALAVTGGAEDFESWGT